MSDQSSESVLHRDFARMERLVELRRKYAAMSIDDLMSEFRAAYVETHDDATNAQDPEDRMYGCVRELADRARDAQDTYDEYDVKSLGEILNVELVQ